MADSCCIGDGFVCRTDDPKPAITYLEIKSAVGADAPRVRNRAEDVRIIQQLLNKISFAAGGPALPLTCDGICGKLTRAAIARFQKVAMGTALPDGIVDPERRTLYKLNELGAPQSVTDESLRALYRTHIAAAGAMILAGLRVVQFALMQANLPNPITADGKGARLLAYHFKLDKASDPVAHLSGIDRVLRDMHAITAYQPHGPNQKPGFGFLESGTDPDMKLTAYAFAYSNGAHKSGRMNRNGMRVDLLYLTRRILSLRDAAISYAIVHELAHFVGNAAMNQLIGDPAYLHRQQALYEGLSPDKAALNADCYSQFCHEAQFGMPFRP